MTLASSSGPSPSGLAPSVPGAAHDPAAFVLACGLEVEHALSIMSVRAASQKWRCRISLSRGRKSYSMSSRCIVSRWRRRTAVEIEIGDCGSLVAAGLDRVQRVEADLLAGGILAAVIGVVPLARRGA